MVGNSTPFNWLVSRCTPEMIRSAGAHTATNGAAEEHADDDLVELVVELVRPVDDRRVDAEAGDLAQPAAAEQRRPDAQRREHLVGVAPVDEVREHPDARRRRDQRDQPVAGREHRRR